MVHSNCGRDSQDNSIQIIAQHTFRKTMYIFNGKHNEVMNLLFVLFQAFANEEDVTLRPPAERKKMLKTDPDVERVRRSDDL